MSMMAAPAFVRPKTGYTMPRSASFFTTIISPSATFFSGFRRMLSSFGATICTTPNDFMGWALKSKPRFTCALISISRPMQAVGISIYIRPLSTCTGKCPAYVFALAPHKVGVAVGKSCVEGADWACVLVCNPCKGMRSRAKSNACFLCSFIVMLLLSFCFGGAQHVAYGVM